MYPLTVGLAIGSKDLLDEVQLSLYDLPVRVVLEQRDMGELGPFLEKLEKVQPDVLLVGMQHVGDLLEEVIRGAKATTAVPKVIVVSSSPDPDSILRAVRAGADEYLYPPLKEDLHKALERMGNDRARERAGTRPRGKILGFLSAKGACGATTLACHLAVELHRLTKLDVLLADFDLDGGMVGFLMKSQSRYSILDAIQNSHRLDRSFWKALVSNGFPGVDVISSPVRVGARPPVGGEHFSQIMPFVRSNYDWAVIDLGSSLTPAAAALLGELDEAFLVTTLEIPALHQAKEIVRTVLDAGYAPHRLHVLLNRMPKRPDVTVGELEKMLGAAVYATLPGDYQGLQDAYSESTLMPPNSSLGRHFARVAAKIAGVHHKEKKKFSFLG